MWKEEGNGSPPREKYFTAENVRTSIRDRLTLAERVNKKKKDMKINLHTILCNLITFSQEPEITSKTHTHPF